MSFSSQYTTFLESVNRLSCYLKNHLSEGASRDKREHDGMDIPKDQPYILCDLAIHPYAAV
jgi:hypothetical protein